jgi:hypothetical protein
MSVETDCSICLEMVDVKMTGRVEMTCGHSFHFKCLAKWFWAHEQSTCPMCRKKATEMEDFMNYEEDSETESEEGEEEYYDSNLGGVINIHRNNMDALLRFRGGHGVTEALEEYMSFNEYGEVEITRYEFERILVVQGCSIFSTAEWNHLTCIYPVQEAEVIGMDGSNTVLQAGNDATPTEIVVEGAATTSEHLAPLEQAVFQDSSEHACQLTVFSAGSIPDSYVPAPIEEGTLALMGLRKIDRLQITTFDNGTREVNILPRPLILNPEEYVED